MDTECPLCGEPWPNVDAFDPATAAAIVERERTVHLESHDVDEYVIAIQEARDSLVDALQTIRKLRVEKHTRAMEDLLAMDPDLRAQMFHDNKPLFDRLWRALKIGVY